MRKLALSALMVAACVSPEPAPPESIDEAAVATAPGRVASAPGPILGEVAVYRVAEGDTLWSIGAYVETPWPELAKLNGLADPDRIEAEQALLIPVGDLRARGVDPVIDLGLRAYTPPRLVSEPPASCDVQWRAMTPAIGMLPSLDQPACQRDHQACTWHEDDDVDWSAHERMCAPVRGGRVCAARWAGGLWIERGDGRRRVIATFDGFGEGRPEVAEVDLDRDGDDEIVISDVVGVSNGIAIETDQIAVLEDLDAPAVTFETQGWNDGQDLADDVDAAIDSSVMSAWPSSSMIQGATGCELLVVRFTGIGDPIAGYGNYDVGRRLAYHGGELHVVREGFLAQRYRDDAPVELRADDPDLADPVQWSAHGTITAVDAAGLTISVRGTLRRFVWWRASDDEPDELLGGVGWRGDPGLLPDRYVPGDASHWIGHDATIERRSPADESGDEDDPDAACWASRIVWIDP